MAAPAAPITDQWAKARRDARIHALLVKFGGDVDRVANIGWYCTTWTKADVLRVRRDHAPDRPPAVVPPSPKPGRPSRAELAARERGDDEPPALAEVIVPEPREEPAAPRWPATPAAVVAVPAPEPAPLVLDEVPKVPLTPMHMQVLQQTCRGLSNKAIGRELLIAEDTVKTHLRAIFRAFGVGDRTTLVIRVLTFEQQPVLATNGQTPAADARRRPDVVPEPKPARKPEPKPEPPAAERPKAKPGRRKGVPAATDVTHHGEPRGYGQHRRLGIPFPEDSGGEPCGCRKAHSDEVTASHNRKHGRAG